MMTPQEVASHAFAKATLGGYNMAMVDEFLDLLTEQTDKNIARRLIDFLSGVAYANEGTIKKVALSTYIITPYNVEILGDLIDELENNGLYL